MDRCRVDFDSIEWQTPMPGVRHKCFHAGGTKLRLVEYFPEMEPHWCTVGHFGQVLVGTFEIEFDHGTEIFEAGDGVAIPEGHKYRHRARAMSTVVRAIFVEKP